MKEQNGKEKDKEKEQVNGEEKSMKKKRIRANGEKKFYLFTAIGCAAALVAIVIVAIAISVGGNVDDQAGVRPNSSSSAPVEPDSSVGGNGDENGDNNGEQVAGQPEGMVMPVEKVTLLNEYGFYHNKTLNAYYEHAGVDFSAEAGTNVMAADDGVIESVYKSDILSGTEIVIKHEDGLKSVYRFITEVEGLKAGDKVKKGDVIATVAEANGDEYKDGAHLHFEILKNGENVDPAIYLTLEEK